MRRKNLIGSMVLALAFCMSAIFTPFTAYAAEGDTEETAGVIPVSAEGAAEQKNGGKAFTPDGQATVADNVTDADGKEFYTFTTPEGNVFYLVIDHERESENVYFLNAVTEADLTALAAKADGKGSGSESAIPEVPVCSCADKCEAGMVDVSCPVCRNDLTACAGKEKEKPGEGGAPIAEKPAGEAGQGGGTGMYLFLILAMAAAGGVGYYLKIYKPKHELDDAEDLDELLGDGDEVTEDGDDESTHADTDARNGGTYADTAKEASGRAADYEDADGEREDAAYYDDYPDEEAGQEE